MTINLLGENRLRTWENGLSGAQTDAQTRDGRGLVTWWQVPEGLRRPSSPRCSQVAGKRTENREAVSGQ